MRKLLAILTLCLCALGTKAQVDNYALRFTSNEGLVNLGTVSQLKSTQSYTLQMWICPSQWTQRAALMRCGTFSIRLGNEHALVIDDGTNHFSVTSGALAVNTWTHVTLRVSTKESSLYINNTLCATHPARLQFPCAEKSIWLGGQYRGRIDEVRVWNTVLSDRYGSYWCNTLNEYNPDWVRLVGYWKMDQEQCSNLVDYRNKHHGTLSPTGVRKEKVTDNNRMRYTISLGYGNVERYFDRQIDGPHYWLNNRISIIGAVAQNSDARLYLDREDATTVNGATYLESFNRRTGVLDLPTAEAHLQIPGEVLQGASAFTVETWVYIDEWTEGAYIFKKASANGAASLSLRLGSQETLSLILSHNGRDYIYNNVGRLGTWFHIGFCNNPNTSKPNNAFYLTFNGNSKTPTTYPTDFVAPTMPNTSVAATMGEGLIGKLDESILYSSSRGVSGMATDKDYPLPGEEKQMPVEQYYSMRTYYNYDSAKEIGFDAFSTQGFFDKMRSYTAGMRGVKFTLTVSSTDFDSYLGNATTRSKIAKKIAAWGNDDHFDGIDLDFEWVYTAAKWRNIGLLCQEIRQNMKEGKILSVSPHKVSYAFPKDMMQYVDYFNFQCYGPGDQELCTPEGFRNAYNLFLNYGYPKEKIVLSYSTTTTSGYKNGVRDGNLAPQGYRYLYPNDGSYNPAQNYMHNNNNGADYWIAGLDQVVWRSQFVNENNIGGMMYWDIGNDLPASHEHSMAKATTYWLNSNVEKLVTEVTNPAPAPADDTLAPTDTPAPEDQGEALQESVEVKSLSEVQNNMAYTITNANGLGTIYYSSGNNEVWLGSSSNSNFGQTVDLNSMGARWLLISHKGKYYLYNLEASKFVEVSAFNVTSQPCLFSDTPLPIEVTETRAGVLAFRTYTNEERGYMCASPQLPAHPVCQWTRDDNGSQWRLWTVPNFKPDAMLEMALEKIDPTIAGDVNDDGDINVGDLTALVSFILNNPSENYKRKAADLNGDQQINVTDYTLLVNLILNNN